MCISNTDAKHSDRAYRLIDQFSQKTEAEVPSGIWKTFPQLFVPEETFGGFYKGTLQKFTS